MLSLCHSCRKQDNMQRCGECSAMVRPTPRRDPHRLAGRLFHDCVRCFSTLLSHGVMLRAHLESFFTALHDENMYTSTTNQVWSVSNAYWWICSRVITKSRMTLIFQEPEIAGAYTCFHLFSSDSCTQQRFMIL